MILSKQTISEVAKRDDLEIPGENIFALPEKVLQFGTGGLLRGLGDFYIHHANANGKFNGRIVVVKSTGAGDVNNFKLQDNLYTLCVRGIESGQRKEENIICTAISRVLTASEEWKEVLAAAGNPGLKIIISNTTENGLSLVRENVLQTAPASFPGKLTAFLFERYKIFDGAASAGMIIIPTELIPGNGKVLESYVLELAHSNSLPFEFIEWLEKHCRFCNSLVDRIVPGKPSQENKLQIEQKLGYQDELMLIAEPYNLWVIEGDEQVKDTLSFAEACEGIIICPDLSKYRELKLRMLNGTHSIACAIAMLTGVKTVKQAMEDDCISAFIKNVMRHEIAVAVTGDLISGNEVKAFAEKVTDRFSNPYIEHCWETIAANYVTKMQVRLAPVIEGYYHKTGSVPSLIAMGFAAFFVFASDEKNNEKNLTNTSSVKLRDMLLHAGQNFDNLALVLSNTDLWQTDLNKIPGLAKEIFKNILDIKSKGMKNALKDLLENMLSEL